MLNNATLTDADLYGANLPGAALVTADLENANLFGANLTGADIDSANVQGTNLGGATLVGLVSGNLVGTPVLPMGYYITTTSSGDSSISGPGIGTGS